MKIESKNLACLLIFQLVFPAIAQTTDCKKIKFNHLSQSSIEVLSTPGNTNNDITFENIEPFVDLDIPSSDKSNILSAGIHKNNSVRILNINQDGSLSLSKSLALTDNVSSNDPASTRGICSFNSLGSQLFFPGNGPSEFGFDRIYPYNVEASTPAIFTRVKENNTDDFFIPSDLATAVTVTPNDKFLVYLQANTSNNNLASLQSVEIKNNKSLSQTFIGQDLAKVIEAGTYLELAKNSSSLKSKFVFGIFSNLTQGKSGSGNGFGIFKVNQENGVNTILLEFKKDSENFPLPDLFNTPLFAGFSGFKIVQRNTDLFLFISYFEDDPNTSFPSFNYITKLALFKINIKNDLTKTAPLSLIGKPTATVFKTPPCNSNNFHGISGPIWVNDDILYVADNNTNQALSKNENYLAAYFIRWGQVLNAIPDSQILKLASVPIRTSKNGDQRNTDIVVTPGGNFAYLATSKNNEPSSAKIFGFSLTESSIKCSSLKEELIKDGICDLPVSESLKLDSLETNKSSTDTQAQATIPAQVLPQASTNIVNGRPPKLQIPSGRPPEFGRATEGSPLIDSTTSKEAVIKKTLAKTPTIPTPATIGKPPFPNLGPIELIPSNTTVAQAVQDINIKSLNLSGPDQIIISPRIPLVIYTSSPLERAKLESITAKNIPVATNKTKEIITLDQKPLTLSSETRGAIKASVAGYIIYLKPGVTLKQKDLKNIIFTVIDSKDKSTILTGTPFLITKNKILASLSPPESVTSGPATLATLLNKGGGKKEVISKGKINIFDSLGFENISDSPSVKTRLPQITKIQGIVTGNSIKGGKIIRLTFFGNNFGAREIKIKDQFFITEPFKAHTSLSFADESSIEILRVRVLGRGNKMLVTIRFTGDDITSIPFTISTPKGQFFREKMDIKLFSKHSVRSVILQLDKDKSIKDKKEEKKL